MNKLIFSIMYLFLMTNAFMGLIGAIKMNFRYVTQLTRPLKTYQGKSARRWGIFYFLSSTLFALTTINIVIQKSTNIFFDLVLFITLTILAFILARLSRKYGAYKVKSNQGN